MPHLLYSGDALLSNLLKSASVRKSDYEATNVEKFPEESLPALKISVPRISMVHYHHLLLPGRLQLPSLSAFLIPFWDGTSLRCDPSSQHMLTNTPLRQLLTANDMVKRGSLHFPYTVWSDISRYFNDGVSLPGQIPMVWQVHLAASDATPGSVIELLRHDDDARFFAFLLYPAFCDEWHMLFFGHVLGHGLHGM